MQIQEKTSASVFAKPRLIPIFALPIRKSGKVARQGLQAVLLKTQSPEQLLLTGNFPLDWLCYIPGLSQESAKRKEKIFSFAACRIRKASYLCNPKQNEGCWHPKQMAPDRKGEKSFGQKKKNAELWQPQQRVINKRAAGSFKLDTREPKEGEELLILRCFRKKRQSLRL